jgi:TonB family protein
LNSSTGTDDPSTDDPEPRKSREQPEDSSSPQTLAALETTDRHPEIKGGAGALYLQIHYPKAARRQGIEGRLELEFTVDREGKVHAIEVAKSLHPLCDSAAVDALRSVEFRPAMHQGTPIPVRMKLPIRFQLRVNEGGPLHTQNRSSSR